MHVTVVGAGALGRIYGVRLASGTTTVEFFVRPARAAETSPFVLEQLNGSRRRDTLARPTRVTSLSERTQVVVLTVRLEQLDEVGAALRPELERARGCRVVTLTPILPRHRARLEEQLGRRVNAGMPSVAGYVDAEGVVRYFVPRVASTLVEGDRQDQTLDELARRLTEAGIPGRVEADVGSQNAATTIAFFPLIAAVGVTGSVRGVLDDKALLALALDAAKECEAVATKVGKPATWASLLTRFVGPFTLKPAISMANRLFPEQVRFVEAHFGPKLAEQHQVMGREILELAEEKGVAAPALRALLARRA